MEITIILGDKLLPKKAAVQSALHTHKSTHSNSQSVETFYLDIVEDNSFAVIHSNPDYEVRIAKHRQKWDEALNSIRSSTAEFVIIVCNAYGETTAGSELILPLDIFGTLSNFVYSNGGTIEIVCLIDDVYADMNNRTKNLSRTLSIRQLEWTFAQYLSSQFQEKQKPNVSCFSLHHPVTNLTNIIFRNKVKSVYLCYPINFFRRDPSHPLKVELDKFKSDLANSGAIIYDPLAIDEDALISCSIETQNSNSTFHIQAKSRWLMPKNRILFTEQELDNSKEGFIVSPIPNEEITKKAKAQVPQRDFFWIEAADVILSWRPFLGNDHHAGVLSELQFAIHKNKPIIAYSPIEDGEEHPSPFAAMVSTIKDKNEFENKIDKIINPIKNKNDKIMETNKLPKYCDHTSVGVLIYNDKDEVLLIERGTFPFGMAVPAGHVDEHSSYEEAAIAEVREEVGLEIEVKTLRLVAEGKRENPCRRVNGSWHYWKIYEARATGEVKLSPREAKRSEWCSMERLIELGKISPDADESHKNSLEKVWLSWFSDLKMIPKQQEI
jgi:ADP-ribose pyrophosphatase YjhB (NUDIX family)/nucleoside 2-deoxyribosyltransferase